MNRRRHTDRYVYVPYKRAFRERAYFSRYRWQTRLKRARIGKGYVLKVETFDIWRSRGWRKSLSVEWWN